MISLSSKLFAFSRQSLKRARTIGPPSECSCSPSFASVLLLVSKVCKEFNKDFDNKLLFIIVPCTVNYFSSRNLKQVSKQMSSSIISYDKLLSI